MGIKIQSDEEIKDAARKKFREMMHRKTYVERWEPIAKELARVLKGQNDLEHQNILPEYCHHILGLLKRTIFKAFPTLDETITCTDQKRLAACKTVEEAKQFVTIDWERLGSLIAIGQRGMSFFEREAEEKLKQDGLLDLTPAQNEEFYELLVGDRWAQQKENELLAKEPGKSIEQILEKNLTALEDQTKNAVAKWSNTTQEWGPEAATDFYEGLKNGSSGFLDKDGEIKNDPKLVDTYWMLLMAWPEIGDMIKSSPPKRMNDLWDWLVPFSHAGWIEIQDLEQLISVSRLIKLKLKGPGAPHKMK